MSKGLAARRLALDLLSAVLQQRRPLDEAWAGARGLERLAPRDRAFARHLVATSLRRLGQIDWVLGEVLERPLPPRLARLGDLLRLGVAQLLFLETPPHAAVDSAVRLAAETGFGRQRGLVNAVLRRVDREMRPRAADPDVMRRNGGWLTDRLAAAYGAETADAILAAQRAEPPLDLTLKDPDAQTLWAERLEAAPLPTGGLRLAPGHGAVTELSGYEEGAWWVQDAAASLPARLLGPIEGAAVVDLCAAPGGKTAQLAAAGAQVTAVERDAARLARLTENLTRLGLATATVAADAADWRPPATVEAVLLDAPCSASGTLRRHPDVVHLKDPADLAGLTALQDRLLAAAAEMLAPEGRLVYAVCSLLPEEGPARIATLLAGGAPLVREPVSADEIGGLEALITPEGDLRSLPCHLADAGGMDGFYACRLRRLQRLGETVT